MLVAAAVCPHPPLLVPEIAGAASGELDGLRAACRRAVSGLAGSGTVIVVGGGPETRDHGTEVLASLRPYGLDLAFGSEGGSELPLSLTVGRWLLGDAVPARYRSVAFDAAPDECLDLGRELAAADGRVALLVMGDGSACLSEQAPGYLHRDAASHDADVAAALARADTAALADLDPARSARVQAAGRAAWQVLAGAAGAGTFTAGATAYEAPYGVGYFVAAWSAAG